jgi:hypothetical protein
VTGQCRGSQGNGIGVGGGFVAGGAIRLGGNGNIGRFVTTIDTIGGRKFVGTGFNGITIGGGKFVDSVLSAVGNSLGTDLA